MTGKPATTAIGFVEQPDGSLLVAAGSDDADWALNLRADARCSALVGDLTTRFVARELHDSERNAAITALILKYGTPAERLGRGPAFRLEAASGARS